ncbi:hypothetical protein ACWC24_18340 [Streptomyces sp. NPDC001443]
MSVDPVPSLPETLERLEALLREQDLKQSDLFGLKELSAKTALPEHTVRTLLRDGAIPADSVNDRVRARIKALSDAHLARTGQRMSDLAGNISRELGISGVWARLICSGEKMPSVELLHGLVDFFRVEGGEAFFTAPAPEALNRALLPILAAHRPKSEAGEPTSRLLAPPWSRENDIRGIALRQALDLPQERWNVLDATLKALLEIDDNAGGQ